jgi:hypothetical protein
MNSVLDGDERCRADAPISWLYFTRLGTLHHEYKLAFIATATQRPSNYSAAMSCPSPQVFLMTRSNDERELLTLPCDADMLPLP